jgi:hypothetical protein
MRVLVMITAAIMALVVGHAASAAPLPLILQVQSAPLAWGDCRFTDKLTTALSRNPDLNVIVPEAASGPYPPFPDDRNNIDSLLNWGTEVGGRYLLTIVVDREALERRKTFSVPVLFHRWEIIAVMSGELRLVDLLKRRQVLAEPFEEKLSATRQFQSSAEDNAADPALHVTAAEKSDLFQSLETRLAERLVDKISRYTRGR